MSGCKRCPGYVASDPSGNVEYLHQEPKYDYIERHKTMEKFALAFGYWFGLVTGAILTLFVVAVVR